MSEENAQDENDRKTEIVEVDPSNLPEVESQRKDLIDYEKHRLEKAKIESIEVVRIPSKFAKAEDGKQHKLRIIGEVVETAEIEKDGEKKTIEFRPSELVGMVEDQNGKLLGYPESEDSAWGQIKKAVGGLKNPGDIIGKELPMRINESRGSKFLGFMY